MQSNAGEQHVLSTAESLDNISAAPIGGECEGERKCVRKVRDRRKQ